MNRDKPFKPITLIGCGAQAKYVLEILTITDGTLMQILDPIGHQIGEKIDRYTIGEFNETDFLSSLQEKRCISICLSDNRLKKRFFRKFEKTVDFVNAIHPASTISSNAKLNTGLIINANAIIQPFAEVGRGCMIHAGVIVEHDCAIGDYVNLAPGVILAGGVKVGEGTTVYSGTVVAPNVKIGKYSVVGAGSLVLRDIPDKVVAYGNPATIIKRLDE